MNTLEYIWSHHLFSKLVFFFDLIPFPVSGSFCVESSPVISGWSNSEGTVPSSFLHRKNEPSTKNLYAAKFLTLHRRHSRLFSVPSSSPSVLLFFRQNFILIKYCHIDIDYKGSHYKMKTFTLLNAPSLFEPTSMA